jgi:urease alpha subunit
MSQTFASRAETLAAIAARILGWRPHEFWQATPADLSLCLGPPDESDSPPTHEEIRRMIEQDTSNG